MGSLESTFTGCGVWFVRSWQVFCLIGVFVLYVLFGGHVFALNWVVVTGILHIMCLRKVLIL